MTNQKYSESDLLTIVGTVIWLMFSIWLGLVMWDNFGPRNFFLIWFLSGICNFCGAANYSSMIKGRDKIVLVPAEAFFSLLLGPTVIIATILMVTGYLLQQVAKKDGTSSKVT